MSRCFPYPPPGYTGEQGSSQALIDSIKLQRETELAKAEAKKDRKREKKEKRKHKKEHKKDQLKKSLLPEKKIHKESSTVLKNGSLPKLIQSENEQLERSSLTEEHAKPVDEQKPSTSSDSTQNSSKRKRESSPPAVARQEENSIRSNGNVIRIRLSSQKANNTVVSKHDPSSTTLQRTELPLQKQNAIISRQEPCSTSGRADLATTTDKHRGQVDLSSVQPSINNVLRVCPPRPEAVLARSASVSKSLNTVDNAAVVRQSPDNELPKGSLLPRHDTKVCSTSGLPKAITPKNDIAVRDPKSVDKKAITLEDNIAVRHPKSLDKKLVKAELRYKDLFMNWTPPPPQMELESDDQDWLFGKKKNPDNQNEKKFKPSYNLVCGSNTSLWPRAQFIPEADIYALPYTVPF